MENLKKENKIITVCGSSGIGKSVFAINLSLSLENKKILIIDLDILNNCINYILGIKEKNKKIKIEKIEDLIINYNKKIDLINMQKIIENNLAENLDNFFNKIKSIYDYIIVDTSLECFWNTNRKIMNNSYINIFLIEPNYLEIKKSKRILEIYKNEWKINIEKINIIFNKYTLNSINEYKLKKIFSNYKILGKINLNSYYNKLINKNYKNKKDLYNVKNEFKNIINKI